MTTQTDDTILATSQREYAQLLKRHKLRPAAAAKQSAYLTIWRYRKQLVLASNWATSALMVLATIFCFGAAALPKAMAVILIAVVGGTAISDTFSYGKKKDMASCALRAVRDSAIVLVFLLTSQALMLNLDPGNAIQNGRLFGGAVICLPLLAAIRLAINVQPDPNTPFGKNLSPVWFYRRIKFMNLVWITAFMLVMALGVTDVPNYWPDRLRGFLPILTFGVLNLIQKQPFGRKQWYQTLFTNPEVANLQRLVANLAGGLKRREPFYRLYQVLIGGLLLMVLLQMLDAMFPWLTGHSSQATLFRGLGGVLGMSTTLVSWKFAQHANRSAVKALDAEIARMRA